MARFARLIAANETKYEVTTETPPDSVDAEHMEATGFDVVAHKLPANKEGDEITMASVDEAPAKKSVDTEVAKGMKATVPPIGGYSKKSEYVQLVVEPPSQRNEMSPPPPRRLRLASWKANRKPSPVTRGKHQGDAVQGIQTVVRLHYRQFI